MACTTIEPTTCDVPVESLMHTARLALRIRRSTAKKGDTSSKMSHEHTRSSDRGTALRSSGKLNAKRLTRRPSGPKSSTDEVTGYVARPVISQTWNARLVTSSDPGGPGGTDTRSASPGNASIC